MMLALTIGFLVPAEPAQAERTFLSCSEVDRKLADKAITGSVDLAVRAAAAVGNTDQYAHWFGSFSLARSETVRANLKSIVAELRADTLTVECRPQKDLDCRGGTYAFVADDRPHAIHLCQAFFSMPSMEDALAGRGELENGTREGTIIHETSHFATTAHTADECYTRSVCHAMAHDVVRAIRNADSYQYFAEDTALLPQATPE